MRLNVPPIQKTLGETGVRRTGKSEKIPWAKGKGRGKVVQF